MNASAGPWHFIVNPVAAGGRSRLAWRSYLPLLQTALPGMTFAISTPGTRLGELTRRALAAGHRHIVGVGGDGTHHQILNALVTSGQLKAVTYAPLSLGSGNDWVRTLGTPRRIDAWIDHLKAGHGRPHNIGQITFLETGQIHYFLNVVGLAYDAEVVRIATEERVRSWWKYPLLAFSYLSEYQAPTVRVDYDGGAFTGPVHTVNVGIGRYSGGGMSFVPHADPFGDTLALTVAERLPAWKVAATSWRLYTGSIGKISGITTVHTKAVAITPLAGALETEADGEWLGTGAVGFSLFPGRLSVVG